MPGLGAADPLRVAALARAARLQMEQRAKELSKDLIEHSTESSRTSDDDIVRLDGWAALLSVGCFRHLPLQQRLRQPPCTPQPGRAPATSQCGGLGLKSPLVSSHLTACDPNQLELARHLVVSTSCSSSQEHHTRQAEAAGSCHSPTRSSAQRHAHLAQEPAVHHPTLLPRRPVWLAQEEGHAASSSRDGKLQSGEHWQDLSLDHMPGPPAGGVHAPGDAAARMVRLPSRKGHHSDPPASSSQDQDQLQPQGAQSVDQQA